MVTTLKAVEYETKVFDSSAFVREGRVELYPDAQIIGGVSLSFAGGKLKLQAGGVIGVIPLTETVLLEVTTRVPVKRIEEIVRRSGGAPFLQLPHDRAFSASTQNFVVVDDLIAERFCSVLANLSFEGIYKTYVRRSGRGSSPHGRILPAPTFLSQRTSTRPKALYEHFARTSDNDVNRLILAAGHHLAAGKGGGRSIPTRFKQTLRLRLQMFNGVQLIASPETWRLGPLPANRPVLEEATELSRLILLRYGVRFFGEGAIRLPSFLINMEKVFEDYVRSVLKTNARLSGFDVLDGNLKPPAGAASEVFEIAGRFGNHSTKPDVVLRRDGAIACVCDVKYKPCPKQPDRSNLEQVLVYGLTYKASKVVLIFPCAAGQEPAIDFLGEVAGIACYKATLQLMSDRLDDEEVRFCDLLADMLTQA